MLYPREVIEKNVDLGLELPTTCPYWIRSSYCDPSVRPLPYDPAKAAAEDGLELLQPLHRDVSQLGSFASSVR